MDYEWISPSRFGILSRPVYKPEFWDKVQELDQWTNKEDPIMTCQPMGIPREGTPRRIFQTANDITMLYTTSDYGGGNREFRVDPNRRPQARPKEGARGHLHTDIPWGAGRATRWCSTPSRLSIRRGSDGAAYFHSADMHVVEKFTRKGDEILYEITIEDPDVLVEPWVMAPRTLRLNRAADAGIVAGACVLRSLRNERHHDAASTLRSPLSGGVSVAEPERTASRFWMARRIRAQ